jgi:pimeloyl-ACP methyl ester carboxylesterase
LSGLDVAPFSDTARALGLRLISPDRPGLGASSPAPGRTVAAWADDVRALLDAVRVERAAVLGWSMGGPYALACAALLGERVCGVATLGCPIPADWPGMRAQINRLDRRLMRRNPAARMLLHGLALSARRLPQRSARTTAHTLDERSAAAVLSDPRGWSAGQAEGLAHIDGVLDEYRVMDTPWGLDLERIAAPVRLWQGSADTLVPAPWVVRLGEALPHAQIGALGGEGHVLAPERYEEIFASLSAVARSPSKSLRVWRATSFQSKPSTCSEAWATRRSRRSSSVSTLTIIRPSDLGSRERKRNATSSDGATSASPPVLATMHGQPEAIASSATRPNGSYSDGTTHRSAIR